MFVVTLVVLELTVAPVAWSLLTDVGYDVPRVVFRVAPASALVLLAVMGLVEVIQGWTFLVVALALVTSPLLQGWRQTGLRGVLVDRVSPHAETRRALRRHRRARVRPPGRRAAVALSGLSRRAACTRWPTARTRR